MSRLRWNGGLVWVAVLMLPTAAALGRSGGITSSGMEEGPATCGDCHDGPAPGVVVEWSGPSVMETGALSVFRIEIQETVPGSLQVGSGVNVAGFLGPDRVLFDPALEQEATFPPNLQVLDGEITHTRDVNVLSAPNGGVGVFSYEFPVRAPDVEGVFTLLGALNSFNQNFSTSGDNWNRAQWDVTVVPEPASSLQSGAALLVLASLARRRTRRGSK